MMIAESSAFFVLPFLVGRTTRSKWDEGSCRAEVEGLRFLRGIKKRAQQCAMKTRGEAENGVTNWF